jgi:acetylornithine deacetylase/succinyl-diaminopimelate desuccinylase-like protein
VIPGEAIIELDVRQLPGTTEPAIRDEIHRRMGEELWGATDVEVVVSGEPVEAPIDTPLYRIMAGTLRDHDPEAIPVPAMAPFSTDAKSTSLRLGVPTYGFSPLRMAPGERFLERFHGVDERVSLEALRFGLPVLYDVVRRFCD